MSDSFSLFTMLDTITCVEIEAEVTAELIESDPVAVPQEKTDKFSIRHVGSITLAHGMHDLYSGFLPPLLPMLIEKFGLTNMIGGSLTLFYSLPSLLQPAIGSIADRRNLKILAVLAPMITGVVMTTLGLTSTPFLIMAMLIFAGLSSAALHTVGPAIISKYSGVTLGKGMSFWVNSGSLGYALGTLVLVTVYDLVGLSKLPILLIIGAIGSFINWRWLRDASTCSTGVKLKQNRPKDWRKIIIVMLPIVLIIASRAMMVVSLSTFFPAFLRERGASTWVSGAGMTLIFSAGVVGSYLAGSLSDKFSRVKILAIATLALYVFMLVFLRLDGWLQIPVLLLIGFFELAAMPVLMVTVQEGFLEDRAFINGLFLSCNFVGTTLANPIVGRLADLYSFETAFQVAAWILPLGLLGIFWMYRQKKNLRLV